MYEHGQKPDNELLRGPPWQDVATTSTKSMAVMYSRSFLWSWFAPPVKYVFAEYAVNGHGGPNFEAQEPDS